jgi:LysR family transcriptional regulator for metE and metH
MPTDLVRYSALDLRHLRLMVAVAEARNLTAAARRLRLTTSALSHQLRHLEEIADGPIFFRNGRLMQPTRAGQMLVETARRVLELVYEAEERLRTDRVLRAELIRICAHCYTAYHWLPEVLSGFKRTHPEVEVAIAPEETMEPFPALRENRLDLVLSFDPPADARLATQPLFRDELVLLVNRKHLLARRKFIELEELREEHLIIHSKDLSETYFARQYLLPLNIRSKRFTSISVTEGILEMVRANLGVTVLARWAAPKNKRDKIVAKRLTSRGLSRTWYAVTRDRPAKGSALGVLIDRLRETMQAPTTRKPTRACRSRA